MGPLIALDPELKKKIKEAWTFPDNPPGEYIGSESENGRMYHYYRKGNDFFYENDFSREMRARQKERRRQKREYRVGKTYS